MINYVLRVEFEDDFRFKLVDEQVMGASQAQSQTQEVTAYTTSTIKMDFASHIR